MSGGRSFFQVPSNYDIEIFIFQLVLVTKSAVWRALLYKRTSEIAECFTSPHHQGLVPT
jgi:hypothetical protein